MNYLIILGRLTEWEKSMSILPLSFIGRCFPGHKNDRELCKADQEKDREEEAAQN